MEEKYSNNELGIMLKGLGEKFDNFFNANTEQHKEIIRHQKETNGNVMENTAFRLKTTGALNIMKFLLGFVGLGTIINIFLLIIK